MRASDASDRGGGKGMTNEERAKIYDVWRSICEVYPDDFRIVNESTRGFAPALYQRDKDLWHQIAQMGLYDADEIYSDEDFD